MLAAMGCVELTISMFTVQPEKGTFKEISLPCEMCYPILLHAF